MPQNTSQSFAQSIGAVPVEDFAASIGAVPADETPAKEPDSWGKAIRQNAASLGIPIGVTNALIGAGKSALGTIHGGGELIRKIPGVGPMLDRGPSVDLPVQLAPQGAAQQIGKVGGDIAQFMAPAGALSKLKAATATGSGILDALVGAGIEAGSAGAVGSAQTGDLKKGAEIGATAGALNLATQGVLAAAKPLAERIEKSLIKPVKADIEDGFRVQNVFKHELGGTLSQSFDKTTQKINALSQTLKQVLRADPSATVNPYEALFQAADDLDKKALKDVGDTKAIQRTLNSVLEDMGEAMRKQGVPVAPDGAIDLASANELKQGFGEMGAWLHNPSGGAMADPDSAAKEKVANAVYGQLKRAIEQNAKGPVQSINQQLSELIPIKRALIRRLPVVQRQNILNLGDLIGMSTSAWGVSLANRLLRAGTTANVLNSAANQAGALAPLSGQVGAGLTSEGIR